MNTTDTAAVTADELAERVRDGDRSITPADISAARAAEEHAALLAEADRRDAAKAAAAEHAAELAQLRADIAALADDTDEQTGYAAAAVAALDDLIASIQARAEAVRDLGARARALGVAQLDGQLGTDHTGIGWRFDHTTRQIDRVRLDDRIIGSLDPRQVFNRLAHEYLAGRRLGSSDHVPHLTLAEMLAEQDRVVTPPTMVRVRLLRRHGHRDAGTIADYDASTAEWLIGKRMAVKAA